MIERKTLGGSAAAEVGLYELRVSCLTLLEALLEGSNKDSLGRMLRVIEIPSLASATSKSFEDARALPKGSDIRKLLTDSAYSLYLLLLHLKGYQEQTEGLLPGQVASIPSLESEHKAELDKTVKSVEIVNSAGEQQRLIRLG